MLTLADRLDLGMNERTLLCREHDVYIARLKHVMGKGGFKGVREVAVEGETKFAASITYDKWDEKTCRKSKVSKELGVFPTDVEAAKAYDKAVIDFKNGRGVMNFEKYTYERTSGGLGRS